MSKSPSAPDGSGVGSSQASGQSEMAYQDQAPIAFGRPTTRQPISGNELTEAVAGYTAASVGQQWLGPAGLCEDGTPWIALITADARLPRRYQVLGSMGLIAWRWNVTPSCPVTLTAIGAKEPRPFARWIAADDHPVVQAIRKQKRLFVCMATSSGARSGWFEATFTDLPASKTSPALPSAMLLERLWTFSRPGIPRSVRGTRYDPFPKSPQALNEETASEITSEPDEIPMWAEPISDIWRTFDGKGPWDEDLGERDRAICAWARAFYYKRWRMAGFVQVIKESQETDGVRPLFNPDGSTGLVASDRREEVERLLADATDVQAWLLAIAGPNPCAHRAHEAAVKLLGDPLMLASLFAAMQLLSGLVDEDTAYAIQFGLEAAFLDHRITGAGTKRPWLQNVPGPGLALKTITLDRTCTAEDLETLWRVSIEPVDMIDAGDWLGPADMPAPLSMVNDALSFVQLEGSVDEANRRVRELLLEAHSARQWSVPWGARVQIAFGPFVAMRVFERQGEFSCLFLDEKERYLHVAVGLWAADPKISCVKFIRHFDESGETVWNDDAAVSLQLITAAILRDFLVVEDRESVFSARPYRTRIAGRNVRTVIYLPRVRYERMRKDDGELPTAGTAHRSAHAVGQHFRKAGSASAAQRLLAEKFGVTIPEGFTFVKPHSRGGMHDAEAIKVYRSRSASKMIFEEIATAPTGARPAWFEFEKACARLLRARGMTVIHQAAQRDGDGGVDLFATDGDGTSWVVQCKCWAAHRLVGPETVRELVGTIQRVDRGGTASSQGMLITTSSLTRGAAEAAATLGFKVIEGATLAAEMARNEAN